MLIPSAGDLDIVAKWGQRRNFVLPDSQLSIRTLQYKLWKDFQASPLSIAVWLAESWRTRACMNKTIGHQLSLVPGKPAETVEVIADSIDRAFELYNRIRAIFMTLAYISITKPTWFPLQVAMLAADQVMSYITCTYNGRSPPVKILVEAWAGRSTTFPSQCGCNQGTLRTSSDTWAPGSTNGSGLLP